MFSRRPWVSRKTNNRKKSSADDEDFTELFMAARSGLSAGGLVARQNHVVTGTSNSGECGVSSGRCPTV